MEMRWRLVRAEVRKLVSARALLALPVASVLYAAVSFGPAFFVPESERSAIEADALLHVVRGPGMFLAVAMLVLGALASAGEFRHGTIVGTLLVAPDRRQLVAAKAGAVAVVAAAAALSATAVSLALGAVLLRSEGLASTAGVGDLAMSVGAVVAVAVLFGAAGVGVGMAVRDQTASVGAVLVWVGIAEGVVPIVLRKPWLFKWMPSGAANALLGVADPPGDLLAAWAGGLLLATVAAALTATGAALFARRDAA